MRQRFSSEDNAIDGGMLFGNFTAGTDNTRCGQSVGGLLIARSAQSQLAEHRLTGRRVMWSALELALVLVVRQLRSCMVRLCAGAGGGSGDGVTVQSALARLRSNSVMQSFDLGAGLARLGQPAGDTATMDGYMCKIGRKTKRMTRR